MTIEEVENYFVNLYRACLQLKIVPQNMTKWRKQGYIPLLQQYRIAELTHGALMPDDEDPKFARKRVI